MLGVDASTLIHARRRLMALVSEQLGREVTFHLAPGVNLLLLALAQDRADALLTDTLVPSDDEDYAGLGLWFRECLDRGYLDEIDELKTRFRD